MTELLNHLPYQHESPQEPGHWERHAANDNHRTPLGRLALIAPALTDRYGLGWRFVPDTGQARTPKSEQLGQIEYFVPNDKKEI